MSEFLPENYEAPKTVGNYMRLEEGENVFRVLTSAVVGFEGWKDNKPVRTKIKEEMPTDIDKNEYGYVKIKHFWAFGVWSYKNERVQVLQLTQKTIMSAIQNLVEDAEWGDPKYYDIKIIRKGEGLETEYNVQPRPHSELSEEAQKEWENTKLNLDALFEGDDPFKL